MNGRGPVVRNRVLLCIAPSAVQSPFLDTSITAAFLTYLIQQTSFPAQSNLPQMPEIASWLRNLVRPVVLG